MDVQFSIIIPTYNRSHLILETIKSAILQDKAANEIIIVDDGSTDDTETKVKRAFGDQVRYLKMENKERGSARNTGTKEATGDYIYFLDSDDLLYPNHLSEAARFITKNNRPEWIFQEYEIKGAQQTIKVRYNRKNPIKTLVTKGNFMSCHGVFLRRDIARKYEFSEDRTMAGSEDYALWLQLAARYILHINPIVSAALVQHEARSVFNFDPEALVQRKITMLNLVLDDAFVLKIFSKWIPQLKANTYSYIALHLAMLEGKKKCAFKWWLKSMRTAPWAAVNRRSFAIVKHLIFR